MPPKGIGANAGKEKDDSGENTFLSSQHGENGCIQQGVPRGEGGVGEKGQEREGLTFCLFTRIT